MALWRWSQLWLVWIYYSWLTFLLGIKVSHAAQNMHLLQRRDRRRALSLENELIQRVNGVVAARIMAAVCTAYMSGEKVMPRRVLEDIFDLSGEVLTRIATRLARHDLVIEVEGEHNGYLPARPPSEITLAEVLAVFRGEDMVQLTGRPRTRLDHILAEIDESTPARTATISFSELNDEH